jgi:hypothetical protein
MAAGGSLEKRILSEMAWRTVHCSMLGYSSYERNLTADPRLTAFGCSSVSIGSLPLVGVVRILREGDWDYVWSGGEEIGCKT